MRSRLAAARAASATLGVRLALALLVLAPADRAWGQGLDLSVDAPVFGRTTYSLTSTTIYRFRGNNYDANLFDDDFHSLYQRFDQFVQSDQVRVENRLDIFVPFPVFEDRCPPLREAQCYLAADIRPERFTVRWEPTSDWTIEGGDSQIVFGRGIALSFRKVDLLGVDTALRGGHVRYHSQNIRFGLHGGVANPQNQDPIDLRVIHELDDIVAGGNFGFTTSGTIPVSFGAHALRIMFQNDADSGSLNRSVDIAGWTFEAPSLLDGALALYFEANGMRRQFDLSDGPTRTQGGRAIYASAQLQLTNLTVLFEWKDYSNYLVAPSTTEANAWRIYSASPPVEYEGPQRLRAIGNQRGGGVRIDYAFLPGPWSFSVNSVFYGFNEEPTQDAWNQGIIVSHSWASLARRQEYGSDITWSFSATGGARFEVLDHNPAGTDFRPGDLDRWMVHGQAELTIGSGDHAFDISVDHRHERELRGPQVAEFQIGGASVTYTFGIPLSLTLALRWTDYQRGVVDQRALQAYNFLGGEFYPSFEGRWTFEPGTFVNVFLGQTPGGQICSGGICRNVPTFEGVRVTFVGRI